MCSDCLLLFVWLVRSLDVHAGADSEIFQDLPSFFAKVLSSCAARWNTRAALDCRASGKMGSRRQAFAGERSAGYCRYEICLPEATDRAFFLCFELRLKMFW